MVVPAVVPGVVVPAVVPEVVVPAVVPRVVVTVLVVILTKQKSFLHSNPPGHISPKQAETVKIKKGKLRAYVQIFVDSTLRLHSRNRQHICY